MQAVMAQTTVKGTVVDDKGETLPATSVRVKGTQMGVITSIDGKFEITIPAGSNPVLQVEAIGFAPYEVKVDGNTNNLVVKMSVSATKMDDVMIIGYGQTTKEKYVGAADKIDADQIEKFPVTSITKAIEGAAPGIQVANSGGPAGGAAIRIRGIGSISASSSPLYVVDGSPYVGDITALNTDDIESITVLKDATATSLYGARGANGVIMITTKRGKMGVDSKPRLSFKAQTGVVTRGLPQYNVVRDEKEFYELAWDAYRNTLQKSLGISKEDAGLMASGKIPGEQGIVEALGNYNSFVGVADDDLIDPVTGKILHPDAALKYHDSWEKELQRTGIRHDYNLSVSGASEKSDYYFSFGYLKEDGFLKYSNYDRFTGRININSQINNWLKTGLNVAGSMSNYNDAQGDGSTSVLNPFFAMIDKAPIYPVYYYNENNEREIDPLTGNWKYDWGTFPISSVGTRTGGNPLGSLSMNKDISKEFSLIAVPYLEAKFLKYFTFHTDINMNVYNGRGTFYGNPYYGQYGSTNGYVFKSNQNMFAYTWKQTLSFDKSFDKHHVNALVNHENYALKVNTISAAGQDLTVPGIAELANTTNPLEHRSIENNATIESYLGNIIYDYDNKYFLSSSIRRDGTSRFSPKSRWGTFWALGLGWSINEESFMQDVTWVDLLKIKASYGTQGNENTLNSNGTSNYYPWQSVYDLNYKNGNQSGGIVLDLGNPELHWENSKQLNAGFEFSLFKRRLSGEFNYFIRTNADLIFGVPLAPSTGIVSILSNTATLQNKGVELTLNGDIVRGSDFNWNATMNVTHFKSNITKMPELTPGVDSILNGNYMWKVGHSIYDYYLVESHVDRNTGEEKYYYYDYDEDSNYVKMDTTSYAYATGKNGRDYRGSSLPKLSGAMTNNFSYKGFDLSVMFTFGLGGKYYDRIYQRLMGSNYTLGNNFHKDMLNRWTEDNPDSDIPKLEVNNQDIGSPSTRFLIDGSYFNLRNISLGYTFKHDWIKAAGFTSLRVSFAADNVVLLTKRRGMDPQGTFGGNPDYRYSPNRTFVLGVNLGL